MGSRGITKLDGIQRRIKIFAQRIWPKATAATAEKMVMLRAVIGFCPWATAKVVITPAPRQATVSWVRVEGRLSKFADALKQKLPAESEWSRLSQGVRYVPLGFVTWLHGRAH